MTEKAPGCQLGRTSYYSWMLYDSKELGRKLERAVDEFRIHVPKMPDAIAYTGSSGSAIAFPLAMRFGLPIIYVRKKNEDSHGEPIEVNSYEKIKNYLIVDDFVRSGKTVRDIKTRIERRARQLDYKRGPECLGVYCWTGVEKDSQRGQMIGHGRYREFVKFYGPLY